MSFLLSIAASSWNFLLFLSLMSWLCARSPAPRTLKRRLREKIDRASVIYVSRLRSWGTQLKLLSHGSLRYMQIRCGARAVSFLGKRFATAGSLWVTFVNESWMKKGLKIALLLLLQPELESDEGTQREKGHSWTKIKEFVFFFGCCLFYETVDARTLRPYFIRLLHNVISINWNRSLKLWISMGTL